MENKKKLYENIYGLFDYGSCTFAEGSFNISINQKKYKVTSLKVVQVDREIFDLFNELPTELLKLKSIEKNDELVVPNPNYVITTMDYFDEEVLKKTRENNRKIISKLSKRYHCVIVRIDHFSEFDDDLEFINKNRNKDGIEEGKEIYLKVVREFHNYHIVNDAPFHYMSDIHYRNIDGIFSYFSNSDENRITNVKAYSDYWTPKHKDGFQERAETFFNNGLSVPIEDLLISKALVYSEQNHFSLAIIHAVMSLEVVVPKLTNQFLKKNYVDKHAIKDFDNKFGLSVRVKAFMKVIFPKEVHEIIDSVGETISIRNKIMHSNLSEQILTSQKTDELVKSCYVLKGLISEELKRE